MANVKDIKPQEIVDAINAGTITRLQALAMYKQGLSVGHDVILAIAQKMANDIVSPMVRPFFEKFEEGLNMEETDEKD